MQTDKHGSSPNSQNNYPKVSEKSTKSELWTAYNQLVAQLEGRAAEPSPELQAALAHDPSRSLAELKLKLSQQLDALGEEVQADIANLADVRRAIKFERRQLLEARATEKQQLINEMAKVRHHWEEEQQEHDREQSRELEELLQSRQREDDEFQYNLQRKRRSDEDAYNQKHAEREVALEAKELSLAEREQHMKQLEAEIASWPKRLDDTVAAARAELSKEAAQRHTAEIRELKLIHQHEVALANVKIHGLEQQLKNQGTEVDSLKSQLADASRQLKDMAVTVIEARSNEYRAVDNRLGPVKQSTDSGHAE